MSSKYAAAHQSPQGPGDARPTALQIIKDQNLEDKLSDKTILITGCSSGLGVETARALHITGATLYLTVRDVKKAEANLGDLAKSPRVHFLHLELNTLDSLNILIENAGVMACPEGRTIDGFETQIGSNHLAHFLLFYLLKPTLLASSTPEFNSRVVILSSAAHRISSVHLDNLSLEGEYEPWKAYGQSKTAGIWVANEIERQYGAQGLHAFSLHPGGINTDLQRHTSQEQQTAWSQDETLIKIFKSPQQGAATTVLAAVAKELEGQGGKYLEDCQISEPYDPSNGLWGPGYASWAYDVDGERKFWKLSLELVGLKDE
ncbi:short-chain dehydrogenase [Aspergillus neoniger CBS 115656]|uniref:Short-chain dehydrogenase n=1 Tax=Aspergillus neoniger (strain CBS 115656) TaxID=1448310 RepID=A0A318Y5V6_ASPNB|nr:short-chain dehydrogenase [Aspergillus neoniger CBS 115656]PYH29646.1 short-chain dehydrogenase [Aspergillus neoniger CBS 115656]